VIVDFGCGMKCIGKPGSSDLICDIVSNAIIRALESSLDTTISSDPLFDGLSIAKIVEGISEALKLMSTLDTSNPLTDRIENATDVETMERILTSSVLGSLFEAIKTMALERKAYNEAIARGMTHEEALEYASAAAWSVEKVINMLTGIGMDVEMEFDGMMSIFGELFENIDTWVGIPFTEGLRSYVLGLYTALYMNNETLNTTLVCRARKDDGNEVPIIYPPYKVSASKLSCYDTSSPSETDAMGVTTGGGTALANDYRVGALIKPSVEEANRNDPTGIYDKYNDGMQDFRIGVLRVFDEFQAAMQKTVAEGGCADYVIFNDDGYVNGFLDGWNECIMGLGMENYFSGVLGIFKFMRNRELREIKFSLDDLYNAMVGVDYMNVRLFADLWQVGLPGNHVEVNIIGENDSTHIQAYQLYDTGTSANGSSILNIVCPTGLCDGAIPKSSVTTTLANFKAMLNTYKPGYSTMMGDFENLPTMSEIKNFIFTSSHFEPYNLAGSKTINVMGNQSGTTGEAKYTANAPIMCKINNANNVGDFVAGTSSITCEIASSVTWDSDGRPSASTYASYYALQERGGWGAAGQSDLYYGLIRISNGTEYMLNGRQFRVRGVRSGYSPADNPTVNGSTLQSKNLKFCDTRNSENGSIESYCWREVFDYVAVSFPLSWYYFDYYYPYTWDVPITWEYWNGDSESYVSETWNMPIAMTQNNTPDNYDDDWAVCLKMDETVVDTTGDDGISEVVGVTVDNASDIVNCFTTTDEYFYYLNPEWGATQRTEQQYHLVRNDGVWMRDASPDASLVLQSTIEAKITGGVSLGPTSKEYRINWYEVANLSHDAKYDPYCDDRDNDGECDCTDENGDGECTLSDTFTEPTLSDPPFWYDATDADSVKALTVLQTCGNKSGLDLSNCLATLLAVGIDARNMNQIDWNRVIECTNTEKTMSWVDIWRMVEQDDLTNNFYGKGCGTSAYDYMGTVRMLNLRQRNNAYDIERPNKMLRLISAATASTGTGVTVERTEEVFSFQEALALVYLRLSMPVRAQVKYNNTAINGAGLYFKDVRIPGRDSDPASGLLRLFLEKGGVIDPATSSGLE